MANTSTNTNTVVAYFSSLAKAQSAGEALKDAGFKADQIGVAAREAYEDDARDETFSPDRTPRKKGFWHIFGGDDKNQEVRGSDEAANRATYGSYAYDEYGQDDLRGSLTGLSVPEQTSRYFSHRFANEPDGAVVTVSTSDRQQEAASILRQNGGDLGESVSNYDFQKTTAKPLAENQNIQLYGEVLRVHKDRIDRGEVRIRKEVHTETQTIQVPVTREELVVERKPVSGDQPATGATFEDQEIRIPLTEETASVEKQPVVREEVRVGKREVSNVQSIDEQVRHEELTVDDKTKSA